MINQEIPIGTGLLNLIAKEKTEAKPKKGAKKWVKKKKKV